jgi:hypothetical protein
LTFFEAGEVESFDFVIDRFLEAAKPLSDNVTRCNTTPEAVGALNQMLLDSRPRRAKGTQEEIKYIL